MADEVYSMLKEDMHKTRKRRDFETSKQISVILGEIERSPKKDKSDEFVVSLIKKMHKLASELETVDPEWIGLLEKYIPAQADKDEISAWIDENIDLESEDYEGNKRMRAMGVIVKAFNGNVDGNLVREILMGK